MIHNSQKVDSYTGKKDTGILFVESNCNSEKAMNMPAQNDAIHVNASHGLP